MHWKPNRALLALGLGAIASCSGPPSASAPVVDVPEVSSSARVPVPPAARKRPSESIVERAKEIASVLERADIRALVDFVHPVKGLRFSPYSFIDEGVTLSRQELPDAWTDPAKRTWGYWDGSGDPIVLSFQEYFRRFVYDAQFSDAAQVAVDRVIAGGNTLNNIYEAFPEASFVELHVPGQSPENEGFDWRSLRLVFERHLGVWFLVAIVHDEWTI